eukprot:CAMPEP_0197614460 /NCGR_PEP_ID=MMETSP1326-20131121/59533_1 /TAXON_ID=1155430 /ORGANISM="Genus nov. species nov., Strain RCC2288" /LENGTH=440 /DNA_ID=CAMNT_0043183333 /DNA_START=1172 /DNA_END=2494 /DNA_ORIENTATION=-
MPGSSNQHVPTLPVRHSRFSRPRRRAPRSSEGSAYGEASVRTASSATDVLGGLSAIFPVTDVIAGATARAASQSTIHPLDTVKVRMQAALKGNAVLGKSVAARPAANVSSGKYGIGIGQATAATTRTPRSMAFATGAVLGKVGAEVGSLYKGVIGAAGGAGIAIGAYFAFYGAAKKILETKSEYSVSTIAFLAGGIGALGSSIVKVPAAVCIRSVQANVYPNVIVAARKITTAAGPRGLYTGYLPTLLEDVPDMAVKFAAYETMRAMHRRFTGKSQEESAAAADISMGLIAGAVAAGATTPLDVVKTRMMCNASQRPSFAGAIAGVWRESPYTGFGRVQTFFTGVGPRAFSNGINSAIFFCFFEIMRAELKRGQERRKSVQEARDCEAAHCGGIVIAATRNKRFSSRAQPLDAAMYTADERHMHVTEASISLAHSAVTRK